jgi:hypothetical protein
MYCMTYGTVRTEHNSTPWISFFHMNPYHIVGSGSAFEVYGTEPLELSLSTTRKCFYKLCKCTF